MNQPTFSFRSASYRFARWFVLHWQVIYLALFGLLLIVLSVLLVTKWWNRPDFSLTFFLDLANYLFAVIVFAVGFLGVFSTFFVSLKIQVGKPSIFVTGLPGSDGMAHSKWKPERR